ncbi:uncharacterized protein LOC103178421 [Callorhinchus milii]|uniref:uncharacterized protein LOC103178421 n=1 Tax=Callorhinchus milii TaxID=7868 RepID=UPI001C3F9160|nr:uncharacterized protein LOC103178421 [Callorhinchus milii]
MDECEMNDTEMNLSSQSSSHVRDTEKFHSLDVIENQTEKQRKGNISLPAQQNCMAVYLPKRKQLQRSQSISSLQSPTRLNVDVVREERDKGHMPVIGIIQRILPKIQSSKHCSSWAQITGRKKYAKELHCPSSPSKGPLRACSNIELPTRVLGGLLNSRPKSGEQCVSVQQGNSRSTPHLLPLTYDSAASLAFNLKSAERLVGRPVSNQPIYSSGTAWKDVSRSPDPVLSQKHLNPNSSCS